MEGERKRVGGMVVREGRTGQFVDAGLAVDLPTACGLLRVSCWELADLANEVIPDCIDKVVFVATLCT